ncbi:MAG: hypothetical protein ABIO36_08480, partial [Pyrinomonadaceae bacterium]
MFCTLAIAAAVAAQSTDQNFPTPVTANEISGTIRVRDIGDSRLTSYFYAIDGGQGDMFINVATKNFTGDIDVFTADNFRPLTKMVIYADSGVSETGRLVYLRKGERLVLRIEGRSPNDDPSTFRIKFAGSFIAMAPQRTDSAPIITRPDNDGDVQVNSVGTRVEVTPRPKATIAAEEQVVESPRFEKSPKEKGKKKRTSTEKVKSDEKVGAEPDPHNERKTEDSDDRAVVTKPTRTAKSAVIESPKPISGPEEKKADPLASSRLVIELKDGVVIWRPMNEVLRFSVDKGVLT